MDLGIGLTSRRRSAPAAALLLDGIPVSAAWSLRRMVTAYTGPLVRVRRLSDNAEMDIGADASGWLDIATLLAWVGASSAYVVTWYDQSGAGLHVTQPTMGAQPRIANNGVIDVMTSGRPRLRFYDARRMEAAYTAGQLPAGADASTLMMVVRSSGTVATNVGYMQYGDLAASNPRRGLIWTTNSRLAATTPAVSRESSDSRVTANHSAFASFKPGETTGLAMAVNGVVDEDGAYAMHSDTPAGGTISFGLSGNPTGPIYYLHEAAIFPDTPSADQIARLRANHQSVWSAPA